jgi:hypothetical protein
MRVRVEAHAKIQEIPFIGSLCGMHLPITRYRHLQHYPYAFIIHHLALH